MRIFYYYVYGTNRNDLDGRQFDKDTGNLSKPVYAQIQHSMMRCRVLLETSMQHDAGSIGQQLSQITREKEKKRGGENKKGT